MNSYSKFYLEITGIGYYVKTIKLENAFLNSAYSLGLISLLSYKKK